MMFPPLRIGFWAVFCRIYLVTFSIQQFIAFNKSRQMFRGHGISRHLAGFAEFTPYALVLALLVAGVATVALDLFVRVVVRGLVGMWYHPRPGAGFAGLGFHLEPGERVLETCGARRKQRCGWVPGTLVLTDRRLAFYGSNWHNEPVVIDRQDLAGIRHKESKAPLGSLLLGVPGRLIVRQANGAEAAFTMADPAEVLTWFEGLDLGVNGSPIRRAGFPDSSLTSSRESA